MKIGILQTGHAPDEILSELGDYDAMFARFLDGHGLTFETWNVVDMDFPYGPEAAEGWLITGSKHGAYEDHAFIPPLEALIRDIYTSARPMLGICFGHQIIAQAMGGEVEKFSGGWSVGRQVYDYGGRQVALNAWHQDQVIRVPEMAEVTAQSDFCNVAALQYGQRIWTIQPHPEFGDPMMAGLIEHRAPGVVPEDRTAMARAGLGQPTDRFDIGAEMAAFLKAGRDTAQKAEHMAGRKADHGA